MLKFIRDMKKDEVRKKVETEVRTRYVADVVHLREEGGEGIEAKENRRIEGCAIVFGRETLLWEDAREKVMEVIEPSCVTPDWLREQDVKLNLLHDRSLTIARCNKGVGSLELDVREEGVWFGVDGPRCDVGDRAVALVGNGTYTGCSFEFVAGDYGLEDRGEVGGQQQWLVRHKSFKKLGALTIAMDPAYKDTSVGLREFEDLTEAEKALLEREKEEQEAKHDLESRERKAKAEAAKRERDIALM
jgi:phage head maturation protease